MVRTWTTPVVAVLLAAAGCSALDDGPSLSESVTAEPSATFLKRVENDPFPTAGVSGAATPKKSTTPR